MKNRRLITSSSENESLHCAHNPESRISGGRKVSTTVQKKKQKSQKPELADSLLCKEKELGKDGSASQGQGAVNAVYENNKHFISNSRDFFS